MEMRKETGRVQRHANFGTSQKSFIISAKCSNARSSRKCLIKGEDKRHIRWFLDRLRVNNNPPTPKSYSLFQVKRLLCYHTCPRLRSTLTHPRLLGAPVY